MQRCTAEGVLELHTLHSAELELKVLEKEDGLPSHSENLVLVLRHFS